MDGVEVSGTFKAAAWFDTLALILSRKHGADITVKVMPPAEEVRAADNQRGSGRRWEA